MALPSLSGPLTSQHDHFPGGMICGMTETPRMLHAVVPIDLRQVDWKKDHMSLNQRDHPQERARKTRLWRGLAREASRRVEPVESCGIEIWYRFPDNRRREVGNLQNLSKALVDGIVDAGVLPDDSDRYLVGPDNRRDPVNGPHQVVVRIFRT